MQKNNLITQQTSSLERDLLALHTGNTQSKEWFCQSVMNILETPTLSSFAKVDKLAEVFNSIDARISYIKTQQTLLATVKKQLEIAKALAKQEVSECLLSLGVEDKIEGLSVSSISVIKETQTQKASLEILDESKLYEKGYYRIDLDYEAIESALLSADKRHEVEQYADMKVETVIKPATIRINKRKIVTDATSSLAA